MAEPSHSTALIVMSAFAVVTILSYLVLAALGAYILRRNRR